MKKRTTKIAALLVGATMVAGMMAAITLAAVFGLRTFEQIYLLTNGGPANRTSVLVLYLYNQIRDNNYGGANATSVMLVLTGAFVIVLIFFAAYTLVPLICLITSGQKRCFSGGPKWHRSCRSCVHTKGAAFRGRIRKCFRRTYHAGAYVWHGGLSLLRIYIHETFSGFGRCFWGEKSRAKCPALLRFSLLNRISRMDFHPDTEVISAGCSSDPRSALRCI